MTTSSLELQAAIYDVLTGDGAIMAIANNVYDHVPGAPFGEKTAYISFGAQDTVDDDADCIRGVETTLQVDIWSKEPGVVECKRLTDMVRAKLHRASLTLATNALVDLRVVLTRTMPDPGGDHHGVVQVTAMIEEPN